MSANQLRLPSSATVNFTSDAGEVLDAAMEILIIAYMKTAKLTRQSTRYLFFMEQHLFINKVNVFTVTYDGSNHIKKRYTCKEKNKNEVTINPEKEIVFYNW